jgi:hypothetical protein
MLGTIPLVSAASEGGRGTPPPFVDFGWASGRRLPLELLPLEDHRLGPEPEVAGGRSIVEVDVVTVE